MNCVGFAQFAGILPKDEVHFYKNRAKNLLLNLRRGNECVRLSRTIF